ncbi:MAG: ABC transporter substrate-binding protein [Verrucomicrobiota bacterium]
MHRIISLIASSTETICELGFQDQLVGRSHECDYPASVLQLPQCSEPKFDTKGTSLEIDQRVIATLENALSVYRVYSDKLEELQPTVIVTQDHCEVCAVSLKDVENAACEVLSSNPGIISLAPNSLEDLKTGFQQIANALDKPEAGEALVSRFESRLDVIHQKLEIVDHRPSVVCVEWIAPLMAAGNWVPEIVDIAKGNDLLGIPKAHTPRLPFEKLLKANPEKIIVMPCGWGIEKSKEELLADFERNPWHELDAVKDGEVYLTDGNQYFNRPGPRIADSAEILAEILHPTLFPPKQQNTAWQKL